MKNGERTMMPRAGKSNITRYLIFYRHFNDLTILRVLVLQHQRKLRNTLETSLVTKSGSFIRGKRSLPLHSTLLLVNYSYFPYLLSDLPWLIDQSDEAIEMAFGKSQKIKAGRYSRGCQAKLTYRKSYIGG